LLRTTIVPVVATIGGDSVLAAEAKQLALRWVENHNSVPPDLVAPVLEVAAYHGDEGLYKRMLASFRETESRRDRDRIVDAIGFFRQPGIASQALSLMLAGDIDIRELIDLLNAFRQTPDTEMVPWQFVRTNYDRLIARLPGQLGTAGGSILPGAASAVCSTAGYEEVKSFFRERIKKVSGGERILAKVLEGIQLCEARRTAQRPEVERYLRQLGQ
jgi:aminopeptidase N